MPELTPRLGIKKPLGNENVTRQSFNDNWDVIDAKVATLNADGKVVNADGSLPESTSGALAKANKAEANAIEASIPRTGGNVSGELTVKGSTVVTEASITGLNLSRSASGTFVGDSSASRFINAGFTPKIVILSRVDNISGNGGATALATFIMSVYNGGTVIFTSGGQIGSSYFNPGGTGQYINGIVDGGFRVTTNTSYSANNSQWVYNWVALA